MKPFVMVGYPCLGFTEVFRHYLGEIKLHRWVLISSSYTGINYPRRGRISLIHASFKLHSHFSALIFLLAI